MSGERIEGIGPYIKRLRSAQGWTLTAFAKEVGISRGYLSQLEDKTEAVPAPDLRRHIARVLGITNIDLLVQAGQIERSELGEGGRLSVFPTRDPRSEVLAQLHELSPEDAESAVDFIGFLLTKRGQVVPME